MKKTQLSIIIVSYNTSRLTLEAIESLVNNYSEEVKNGAYEIIVSDNDSVDDTIKVLEAYKKQHKLENLSLLENKKNLGFSKANNAGVEKSHGEYVLFLNPDTIVYPKTLRYMVEFIQKHPESGAVTCKLEMLDGKIDYAAHRGFPTPWNALCHFSKLSKIFPKTKLFNGYTLSYMDMRKTHEVDAIAGAFILMPRHVGEEIGWWDEDYFFNGEDIDFCYKIKEKGYKIYYVPEVSILHYNGAASGIKKSAQSVTTANFERKIRVQNYRFDAMKIFYKKHYQNKYPKFINACVFKGIEYLRKKNIQKLQSYKM